MPFALALDPPSAPGFWERPLLGLSLPLRLALSAQAAGASAIVVTDAAIRSHLVDARLVIPVLESPPSGLALYRVPCSYVIHRDLLSSIRDARGDADTDLTRDRHHFAPPYGFDVIDVISRAQRVRAEHALLRALRKPQDGWTSTYLNRYLSLFVTRLLVATPLRPNYVSVGILAIGLLGAYMATLGTYPSLLLGASLFQAQSVLDGCDGEMSRLTFRGSKAGEWLDTVGDDLTNYGYFAGASLGLYRTTASPLYLTAGAVIVACGLTTSAIEYRYLIKIGSGDLLKYPLGIGSAPGARGRRTFADAVAPLFKRDTFVFLTLLAAFVGALAFMLVIFAFGAVGILIAVVKAELRMARERRALPSG